MDLANFKDFLVGKPLELRWFLEEKATVVLEVEGSGVVLVCDEKDRALVDRCISFERGNFRGRFGSSSLSSSFTYEKKTLINITTTFKIFLAFA